MPIQKSLTEYIKFDYSPSYLDNDEHRHTITDVSAVCAEIQLAPRSSSLKVDGGNIIRGKHWIILTDMIFKENPRLSRKAILKELESLFDCKPIIIPREPGDYLGHSDGMVRYYDEATVLINSYRADDKPGFQKRLKQTLKNEGFQPIEVPYNPYDNDDYDAADGVYLNFLQMKEFILLPTFEKAEDEVTVRTFENLFPEYLIETIDASVIAKDGGVLNCISWNIKTI